jgi:hypothetical protein
MCSQVVRRAPDASSACPIENVRVDHGGLDVSVAQEFLDGTDIVSVFEEMGRERVPDRVAVDRRLDPCVHDGLRDRVRPSPANVC